VKPVGWHPLSILAGFALAAITGIAVLQVVEPGSRPGVLEVTELRVVDGQGRVLARLGPNVPNGARRGGRRRRWAVARRRPR
jgi:hypothetical protein